MTLIVTFHNQFIYNIMMPKLYGRHHVVLMSSGARTLLTTELSAPYITVNAQMCSNFGTGGYPWVVRGLRCFIYPSGDLCDVKVIARASSNFAREVEAMHGITSGN